MTTRSKFMRNLILLFLCLSSITASAANYGKFKLSFFSDWNGEEAVEFLLNKSGEVKILENEYYYDLLPNFFFGEVSIAFLSGGDEDYVKGKIALKDNKIVEACAVLVDGPGAIMSKLGVDMVSLSRWDKKQKKYIKLSTKKAESSYESCVKTYVDDYADRGYEIHEY